LAGFTIIELLASVAIIGLLASVAMPVIQTALTRQKEAQLRAALISIRNALDAYNEAVICGNIAQQSTGDPRYPFKPEYLIVGIPNQLYQPQQANQSSQCQQSNLANQPQMMYFLRSIPRDPFYPDKTTPAVQTWAWRSYSSDNGFTTYDQVQFVFDVQSMSMQTGLNGVPYNQW